MFILNYTGAHVRAIYFIGSKNKGSAGRMHTIKKPFASPSIKRTEEGLANGRNRVAGTQESVLVLTLFSIIFT
jgi:hypothetical protein